MSSIVKVVGNMLAPNRKKTIMIRLCISLFLINNYSNEIGHLVNEATENGMIKDIELTSEVERVPGDVSDEEMIKHATGVIGFFGNYPIVSCCLTKLLYNATFVESDLHNLMANICTELQYLYLYQCDTGFQLIFMIDAPNSKLNVLEFAHCTFGRAELLCLPKLEQLICGYWLSQFLPLTLGGYVPPQGSRNLFGHASSPRTIQIWLQPEKYQLSTAFRNLRRLCLYDIFVGFGLLWTIALLDVALSLEIFEVEVDDHRCDDVEMKHIYAERTNAPWEVSEFAHPKHLALKELEIIGFNASEEHVAFLGAVMERASNLEAVRLKDVLQGLQCNQYYFRRMHVSRE